MAQFQKKRIDDVFAPFMDDSYPESFRYAEITDIKINRQSRELRLSAVCAAYFDKADTLISKFSEDVKEKLDLLNVIVNLSVPEKDNDDLMDKLREMQEEADARSIEEKQRQAREIEDSKPHHIEPGIPLYLDTAKIIYGQKIGKMPKKISDVRYDDGRVAVWGDVFGLEIKDTRDGRKKIINFDIKDDTGAYPVKIFQPASEVKGLLKKLENGITVIILGDVIYDSYKKENVLEPKAIAKVTKIERTDDAPQKRVELHMHSNMSAMDAMTDAGKLV
ncbi:MAG: hypothetical protein IK036_01270, partial [Clostridia bacterium]|nr:hypothetical protein [Clostridia bacterium]